MQAHRHHHDRFVMWNRYTYCREPLFLPLSSKDWIQTVRLTYLLLLFAVKHLSCRSDSLINKLVSLRCGRKYLLEFF